MDLRREAGLGFASILAIQITLSVLVVVLLARMGPAIERILEENVYSAAAIEVMLSSLALHESTEKVPGRFEDALVRAEENVTEPEEPPLLKTIRGSAPAAFRGDSEARAELVQALEDLGQVNRESMTRADERAKRLGYAGAWAAVLLCTLAFGLGILAYRRMRLRLELPIEFVRRTVQDIRTGNLQARVPLTTEGPSELRQIGTDLNWLLDRQLFATPELESDERFETTELRRLVGTLLDMREHPTVLTDENRSRVASNLAGMELKLPEGDEEDPSWSRQALADTGFVIWTFENASSDA